MLTKVQINYVVSKITYGINNIINGETIKEMKNKIYEEHIKNFIPMFAFCKQTMKDYEYRYFLERFHLNYEDVEPLVNQYQWTQNGDEWNMKKIGVAND